MGLFLFGFVLLFQSLGYLPLGLFFESFHLSISALICLIHWCGFVWMIPNFVRDTLRASYAV